MVFLEMKEVVHNSASSGLCVNEPHHNGLLFFAAYCFFLLLLPMYGWVKGGMVVAWQANSLPLNFCFAATRFSSLVKELFRLNKLDPRPGE